MIPFDFAKESIRNAAEFEETAERIADKLSVDVDDLKRLAADLSYVSLMSPVEALQRVGQIRENR